MPGNQGVNGAPSSSPLAAFSYVIGALSGGLACLAIMAYAHAKKDDHLEFHAKQSLIWDLGVAILIGLAMTILPMVSIVLAVTEVFAWIPLVVHAYVVGLSTAGISALNVLVNVWATWCGACVIEFEEFVAINRMYRRRDFELITISADLPTRKDKVLSFLKAQQASCKNYLFDSEDKYALMEALDKESLGGIPYTILIKPGGEIMYRHVGLIDPLQLKKVIVGHLGRYYE